MDCCAFRPAVRDGAPVAASFDAMFVGKLGWGRLGIAAEAGAATLYEPFMPLLRFEPVGPFGALVGDCVPESFVVCRLLFFVLCLLLLGEAVV